MTKLFLFAVLCMVCMAGTASAAPAKYYIDGVVICDKVVVTDPNLAYCRSISGGDPAGLLYAIDITDAKRPVVKLEGMMKVDPIAHMKILEISDRQAHMGSQCAHLLVENDVITWAWGRPLVDCLKTRTITPALK